MKSSFIWMRTLKCYKKHNSGHTINAMYGYHVIFECGWDFYLLAFIGVIPQQTSFCESEMSRYDYHVMTGFEVYRPVIIIIDYRYARNYR